ncbi:MAG: hypothetical protein KatS3mg068_2184 [Candidatus Sericytochromatia bacterium]|nr:MAG: hypothetical protein KatS3mg068_2184 [Candidatus Sericytochromatia bacterium]
MIVVKTKPYDLISYQAIYEFEESFSNFENITYTIEKGSNKIVKRILNLIIKNKVIKYLPLFNNSNKENVFIILMNINNLYKLFSIYLKNKNISLYIYDLLKSQYNFFFDITNYLEIKNIFFSSKDTADFF